MRLTGSVFGDVRAEVGQGLAVGAEEADVVDPVAVPARREGDALPAAGRDGHGQVAPRDLTSDREVVEGQGLERPGVLHGERPADRFQVFGFRLGLDPEAQRGREAPVLGGAGEADRAFPPRAHRDRILRGRRGRGEHAAVVELDTGEAELAGREAVLEVRDRRAPQGEIEPHGEERLHPVERELERLERAGAAGSRELALQLPDAVGPERGRPVEGEPARLSGRGEVGQGERQLHRLLLGRKHDLQPIHRTRELPLPGHALAEHEVGGERAR